MKYLRLIELEKYIDENEPVSLADLCKHCDISMSTLRRDLDILSSEGKINRMYGCVTKRENSSAFQTLHFRSNINSDAKRIVAKIACRFVSDGDVIFIDSGSTTCLMVEFLKDLQHLTIVTNNLDVIVRSAPYPNLQVYVLPGLFTRGNNSFAFLTDERLYSNYNIQKAFLGSSGITLEYGVSHTDLSERTIKQCATRITPKRYLLLDHTKFGKSAPLHLCEIKQFTALCTDTRPGEPYVEYCEKNGVDIAYPVFQEGESSPEQQQKKAGA